MDQDEQKDRLSSLPDALLIEIINLLRIKSAISTGVLSQRWRNLWTQITSVAIDYRHFHHPLDFYSIVDSFISQLTSPFIRSFSLNVENSLNFPNLAVASWFDKICSRNVEVIKVSVDCNYHIRLFFNPPSCIFRTQSLVELRLINVFDYEFPDVEINLPHLKILRLLLPPSQCWIIAKLTRACPLLEQMTLAGNRNWDWDEQNDVIIDISSQNLKDLFMCFAGSRESTQFVINAPNLGYFCFHGDSGSVNSMVTKPSALQIGVIKASSKVLSMSILRLTLSVKKLTINLSTLCVLKGLREEDKNLSFSNLQHLILEFCSRSVDELSWSRLDSVPKTVFANVKKITIQMTKLSNETHLLNLTKSLLISAPVLEKLNLCVSNSSSRIGGWNKDEAVKEIGFCLKLSKCLQNSQCQVEFFGNYVVILDGGVIVRRADGRVMSWRDILLELGRNCYVSLWFLVHGCN